MELVTICLLKRIQRKKQIERAKKEARNERDCVKIWTRQIKPEWVAPEYVSERDSECGASWIDAIRWIVKNRQMCKVLETGERVPSGKRGGRVVDLFTAGRMKAIYEALNDENRAKFGEMDLSLAIGIAYGLPN